MNRRERRGVRVVSAREAARRLAGDPNFESAARGVVDPRYHECAEATRVAVRLWRERSPADPPVFALPPGDTAVFASLADVGHMLARNDAAHRLVDVLIGLRAALDLNDYPTLNMLKAGLTDAGIAYRVATLEELGMRPSGRGRVH